MTNKNSILLVEDHPAWGNLLEIKLKTAVSLTMCGRVSSIQDAMTIIEQQKPKLTVIDITLSDGCGLALLQTCRLAFSDIHSIVLTAHDEDVYLARAWKNGAKGYLLKTDEISSILAAFEQAAQGMALWSDYQCLRIQHWQQVAGNKWDELTQREQEVVLGLMAF